MSGPCSRLVRPSCRVISFVARLANVAGRVITNVPSVVSIGSTILSFVNSSVVIKRGASFSVHFLGTNLGRRLDGRCVSAVRFTEGLCPSLGRRELSSVARCLNLSGGRRHSVTSYVSAGRLCSTRGTLVTRGKLGVRSL